MLTSPQPTTSATTEPSPQATATVPQATSAPTQAPDTAQQAKPDTQLATEPTTTPSQEVATQQAGQTINVITLWYAVSAVAYCLAFKKAAEDARNYPDGNGLFVVKPAGVEKVQVNPSSVKKDKANQTKFARQATESVSSVVDGNEAINSRDEEAVPKTPEELNVEKQELGAKLGLTGEDAQV
jgi:hypothetical protein